MEFQTRLVSSLTKVFPDVELTAPVCAGVSALQGETVSFQVAFRSDSILEHVKVEVDAPEALQAGVRRVELVPARFICYGFDSDVLRKTPGLYPDPLVDFAGDLRALPHQWQALWVSVQTPLGSSAEERFSIAVRFSWESPDGDGFHVSENFQVRVLPVALPPQKLIHTEWFHVDCLSARYGVPVWSERHWEIVGNYMRDAARHGINMLFTPLFTPPLDTAVGGERLTVQLVDVSCNGDSYEFGFERLRRWIDMALSAGFEYLEMAHLFTQWGAAHAPKVVARSGGEERKIFGWETDSTGPAYAAFLDALLPALTSWLEKKGISECVYFHVSDEPEEKHLGVYSRASALLKRHLTGFKTLDALSEIEFHRRGLVSCPVPAIDHIEPFAQAGVQPLWTYYACCNWKETPNRFLHFPSARNRILGTLLYRYGVEGFLQWGFNFWNSHHSLRSVDPWQTVDADGAFPPGDAFMVYPGPDGKPVDSTHFEVFFEGLQDLRALQLLEMKMGREKLINWLDRRHGRPLSMTDYPRGEAPVLGLREEINALIARSWSHTAFA